VAEYDPPAALWSGTDGLDAIRAVERVARWLLRPGGLVAVEHANRGTERMIYRSEPILMDVFAGQNSACHWAQPRK